MVARTAGERGRGRVLVRLRRPARGRVRQPARRPLVDGPAPAGRPDGGGGPLPVRPDVELIGVRAFRIRCDPRVGGCVLLRGCPGEFWALGPWRSWQRTTLAV